MRNIAITLAATVVLCLGIAMFAPTWLTTSDPLATNTSTVLQPPSTDHWFGTDQSGRDVYTRVIYGTYDSLLVGLRAVGIAMLCGGIIGTIAGVAPPWIDRAVGRLIEITMAFPEFLLALLVIAILGKGPTSVALGVTVAIIPAYVRLARVTARQLRFTGTVDAATVLGVSYPRAVWRHVAPQVAAGLLGLGIVGFGSAIVTAAGLSFLGLGVNPPAPEWGVMMSEGKNQLARAWWITFFPGLALALTVVAVSVLARPLQHRLATGTPDA